MCRHVDRYATAWAFRKALCECFLSCCPPAHLLPPRVMCSAVTCDEVPLIKSFDSQEPSASSVSAAPRPQTLHSTFELPQDAVGPEPNADSSRPTAANKAPAGRGEEERNRRRSIEARVLVIFPPTVAADSSQAKL